MPYRFDPAKLDRLNDAARLVDLDPDIIWRAFGVPEAREAVEVGAGTGMFAVEFARRMRGGTLHAVDSEPLMLAWMAEHLPVEPRDAVAVLQADAANVPLPTGSVDLVYSMNLHHELEDPDAMLAEAFRLLNPGGVLGIVDWKAEETPKGPPLAHRIGAARIEAGLASAGFMDVTVHHVLPYHDVVTGRRP